MTSTTGVWSGTPPISYAYQWQRCDVTGFNCHDITGATSQSYQLTDADVGFTIRSRVYATDVTGTDFRSSKPTAVVQNPPGGPIPPPASGAYFGAYTSPKTGYTIEQREAEIGRRYKIVHFYHGWNEAGTFPDAGERQLAVGRILYLAWDARNFNTNTPTSWAAIAAGEYDASIDSEAAKIKAFGQPLFVDFSQEPELEIASGGYGTATDYAAAYRHIVERFRADGVTNAAWVWDVTGSSSYLDQYAAGLYPGDDVVDWIAWDPYNWFQCHNKAWASFADTVGPFYSWLTAQGHANKPFMLAEFGTSESNVDPSAKGNWFLDALGDLKGGMFANLKALVYFDSRPAACDWRIDTSQASLDGFRALADDPYLNP